MIKSIITLVFMLILIACNANIEDTVVEPKLTVGSSLTDISFKDQFEKEHSIESSTKKVIFALAKESAHTCNDYFNTKEADYLQKNNTQFVADVSMAPSIIRSMFILPGLKDFKHTVLLLNEESLAAPYRVGVDTEKIVVVYLNNGVIENIHTISTETELISTIESK